MLIFAGFHLSKGTHCISGTAIWTHLSDTDCTARACPSEVASVHGADAPDAHFCLQLLDQIETGEEVVQEDNRKMWLFMDFQNIVTTLSARGCSCSTLKKVDVPWWSSRSWTMPEELAWQNNLKPHCLACWQYTGGECQPRCLYMPQWPHPHYVCSWVGSADTAHKASQRGGRFNKLVWSVVAPLIVVKMNEVAQQLDSPPWHNVSDQRKTSLVVPVAKSSTSWGLVLIRSPNSWADYTLVWWAMCSIMHFKIFEGCLYTLGSSVGDVLAEATSTSSSKDSKEVSPVSYACVGW